MCESSTPCAGRCAHSDEDARITRLGDELLLTVARECQDSSLPVASVVGALEIVKAGLLEQVIVVEGVAHGE